MHMINHRIWMDFGGALFSEKPSGFSIVYSSGQGGHAAAKATASAQLPEFASDIFSLSQRKTHINPPFVVSMGHFFFLVARCKFKVTSGRWSWTLSTRCCWNQWGLVGLRIKLKGNCDFYHQIQRFPCSDLPLNQSWVNGQEKSGFKFEVVHFGLSNAGVQGALEANTHVDFSRLWAKKMNVADIETVQWVHWSPPIELGCWELRHQGVRDVPGGKCITPGIFGDVLSIDLGLSENRVYSHL